MSDSTTLSYAVPQKNRWLARVIRLGAFGASAWVASIVVRVIGILGPQKDWNSYIGPEITLIIDAVVNLIFVSIAVITMAGVTAAWSFLKPRFRVRDSMLLWALLGAGYGLACTVPHLIGVACSDHMIDSSGNLHAGEWTEKIQMVLFITLPVLVMGIVLHRRWDEGLVD